MPCFKGEVMIKMGSVGLGMPLNDRAFANMNMTLGSVHLRVPEQTGGGGIQQNSYWFCSFKLLLLDLCV